MTNGGDFYKVGDRLVFDQEESGGSGVAAKVSFVKGKEILSLKMKIQKLRLKFIHQAKKEHLLE